jgi:hypothetical protein
LHGQASILKFRSLLRLEIIQPQVELSFIQFKQSVGLKSWEDLIALVGKDVSIDPWSLSDLMEHMREGTTVHNNLAASESPETIDHMIMGFLLLKIHEGQQYDEDLVVTMFKNNVIHWQWQA